MNPAPFFKISKISAALPMAALLALSACGGGGGSASGEQGSPVGRGTGLPPVAPQAPTLAESIRNPANTFAALSKSISRDYEAQTAAVTDRLSVASVRSDGAGGFHVSYVLDGSETTVHFASGDLGADGETPTDYFKDVDGQRHWFWSIMDAFDGTNYGGSTEFAHVGGQGFASYSDSDGGLTTNLVYGLPTDPARMPSGTAAYTGWMYAHHTYDNTLDSLSDSVARSAMSGSVVLVADFADASLQGRIFRLHVQPHGGSWEDLSDSTRIEIRNGAMAANRFTADLVGVDDRPNAPFAESLRGYRGRASGGFYGPFAEEFGAVFTMARNAGEDEDRVGVGAFFGGSVGGPGERVDGDALSAGVDQTGFSSASPRIAAQSADNRVTAIAPDGAGGYRISYRVDGTLQTVSLRAEDIGKANQNEEYAYYKRDGTRDWWFARAFSRYGDEEGGPVETQGRYYSVRDWWTGTYPTEASTAPDSGIWGTVVHGTRTAAARMPGAGQATYAGHAAAYVFDARPDEGQAGVRHAGGLRGHVDLTADFAAGRISGRIADVERSTGFWNTAAYRAVPGGALTLANGRIEGNVLSADLSGLGYTGRVSGAFYGPAADEAAGVLQATGANQVVHGWFGAARR